MSQLVTIISPTQLNSRSGFHVFGHSWGSIVATLYAALKPPGDDHHNDGDENPIWNCTSEKNSIDNLYHQDCTLLFLEALWPTQRFETAAGILVFVITTFCCFTVALI